MQRLQAFILVLISGSIALLTNAQDVPIGQWKDYLSYQSNLKVCQGPNLIYCTSQSGVFSYNLNDNSVQRYNRVTGLSGVSPTIARYNPYDNLLLIGYQDGNMDIVQNNQVINIPDLQTATVQGTKIINDIYFVNNIAYVCCGQGILQVDLSQDIILNTFNLSSGGNPINVQSMAIYQDSIFAVTDNGVYKAYFYDPNLNDYAEWQRINAPILPPGTYNAIALYNNQVLVSFSNLLTRGIGDEDTIYSYSSGAWSYFNYGKGSGGVDALENCNGNLVISTRYSVLVINASGTLVQNLAGYGSIGSYPQDAILDASNNIWVADFYSGLVESAGSNYTFIYPPGPYSNDVTAIAIANNNIWITPGGYNQSGANEYISKAGVSTYQNGSWYRILDPKDSLLDINCIAVDPHNPTRAYAGTWGNGVVEYNNNVGTKVYNSANSTLQSVDVTGYYSIRVGAVEYDTLGNLWMTDTRVASQYLSVMKTDGTWEGFDFSGIISKDAQVINMLVTRSGAKWLVVDGVGILVFQDNGTFAQPNATNTQWITATVGSGNLPDINVYSMAQDLNGTVWVGTDLAVAAFYSPDNVLDGNHDWDAQPIYVNQGGYTQYLMQNQFTSAIAVDGANRKWIGTQGGGVFLMSSDGTQQVYNFTSSNSPLLSNNINCITINPLNGEVFFGTDKGIVSFRSTATEGGSVFNNVYAFPNPVPHGYDGVVAIKGLVTNSDVKITTASGQLVYHTVALGGQAIWNGTNFNGQRVDTGVYLVFCASPDGSQSHVTKLLFLN